MEIGSDLMSMVDIIDTSLEVSSGSVSVENITDIAVLEIGSAVKDNTGLLNDDTSFEVTSEYTLVLDINSRLFAEDITILNNTSLEVGSGIVNAVEGIPGYIVLVMIKLVTGLEIVISLDNTSVAMEIGSDLMSMVDIIDTSLEVSSGSVAVENITDIAVLEIGSAVKDNTGLLNDDTSFEVTSEYTLVLDISSRLFAEDITILNNTSLEVGSGIVNAVEGIPGYIVLVMIKLVAEGNSGPLSVVVVKFISSL